MVTTSDTLTLPQLAASWHWSPSRLYRLCEAQAIPHRRICGRLYFDRDTVERWKAAREKAAARQAAADRAETPLGQLEAMLRV